MSSLSIRRLPREVERALIHEAKVRGKTKTDLVLEALEARFNLGEPRQRQKKLRSFFGKLSREEYEAVREATKDFERVDEGMWS